MRVSPTIKSLQADIEILTNEITKQKSENESLKRELNFFTQLQHVLQTVTISLEKINEASAHVTADLVRYAMTRERR